MEKKPATTRHEAPIRGSATRGAPMSPADLPDEPADTGEKARFAPAPGVPVDAKELRRLKAQARRRRTPRDQIAQEDSPTQSKP